MVIYRSVLPQFPRIESMFCSQIPQWQRTLMELTDKCMLKYYSYFYHCLLNTKYRDPYLPIPTTMPSEMTQSFLFPQILELPNSLHTTLITFLLFLVNRYKSTLHFQYADLITTKSLYQPRKYCMQPQLTLSINKTLLGS